MDTTGISVGIYSNEAVEGERVFTRSVDSIIDSANKLEKETTKASEGISKIGEEAKNAGASITDMGTKTATAGTGVNTLRQHLNSTQDHIDLFRQRAKEAGIALDELGFRSDATADMVVRFGDLSKKTQDQLLKFEGRAVAAGKKIQVLDKELVGGTTSFEELAETVADTTPALEGLKHATSGTDSGLSRMSAAATESMSTLDGFFRSAGNAAKSAFDFGRSLVGTTKALKEARVLTLAAGLGASETVSEYLSLLDAFDGSERGADQLGDALVKLGIELEDLGGTTELIEGVATLTVDRFVSLADAAESAGKGFNGLASETEYADDELVGIDKTMRKLKIGLLSAAISALGTAMGKSIIMSVQFEQQLLKIKTLVNSGSFGSGVEELSESVETLSKQFGVSTQNEATALYEIIRSGAREAGLAQTLLVEANRLSTASFSDLTKVSGGLTDIVRGYKLEAESVAAVTDSLTVAVSLGAGEMEALTNAVGDVAPIASSAGASLDELLAISTALSNQGLETSRSLDTASTVLRSIIDPTAKAAEEAAALGINLSEAGVRAAGGFIPFLEDMVVKTGGSAVALKALIGNLGDTDAAFALAAVRAGDLSESYDKLSKSSGQTAKQLEQIQDSLGQKTQKMIQSLADFARATGGFLLSIVQGPLESLMSGLASTLESVAGVMREWTEAIQGTSEALEGLREDTSATDKAAVALGLTIDKLWEKFDKLSLSGKVLAGLIGTGGSVVLGLLAFRSAGALAAKVLSGLIGTIGLVIKTVIGFVGVLSGAYSALNVSVVAVGALTTVLGVLGAAVAGFSVGMWLQQFGWFEDALIVAGTEIQKFIETLKFLKNVAVEVGRSIMTPIINGIYEGLAELKELEASLPRFLTFNSEEENKQLLLDAAALREKKSEVGDLTETLKKLHDEYLNQFAMWEQSQTKLLEEAASRRAARDATKEQTEALKDLGIVLDANPLEAAQGTLQQLVEAMRDAAGASGDFASVTTEQQMTIRGLAAQLVSYEKAMSQTESQIDKLTTALDKDLITQEDYDAQVSALKKTLKEYGVSLGQVEKLLKLFSRATGSAGVENERLLKVWGSLRKTLQPVVVLTEEYEDQIKALQVAQDKGLISEQQRIEYAEILRAAFIRSKEAANGYTDAVISLADSLSPLKVATDTYNEQVEYLIQNQVELTRDGYDVAAMLDQVTLNYNRAIVEAKRNASEAYPWAAAWEQAIQRVDDAFFDLWLSAFDGASDFIDQLESLFKTFAAQTLHNIFTKPIAEALGNAVAGAGFVTNNNENPLGNIASLGGSVLGYGKDVFTGLASGEGFGAFIPTGFTEGLATFSSGLDKLLAGPLRALNPSLATAPTAQSIAGGGSTVIVRDAAGNVVNGAGGTTAVGQVNWANVGATMAAGFAGNLVGQEIFGGGTTGIGSAIGSTIGTAMGGWIGAGIGSFLGEGVEELVGNIFGFGGTSNNRVFQEIRGGDLQGDSFVTDSGSHKAQRKAVESAAQLIAQFADIIGNETFDATLSASAKSGLEINKGGEDQFRSKNAEKFFDEVFGRIIEDSDLDDTLKEALLSFDGAADEMLAYSQLMVGLNEIMADGETPTQRLTEALEKQQKGTVDLLKDYQETIKTVTRMAEAYDGSVESSAALAEALFGADAQILTFVGSLMQLGEEIDTTITGIVGALAYSDASFTDYLSAWTRKSDRLQRDLVDIVDPTVIADRVSQIIDLNSMIYTSMRDFLYELEATAMNITATLASAKDALIEDTLDPQGLSDKWQSEIDTLVEILPTLTSATDVEGTVNRIASLTNQLWGLMDDSGKASKLQDYIDFLDGINTIASEVLGTIGQEVSAEAGVPADLDSLDQWFISTMSTLGTAVDTQLTSIISNIEEANSQFIKDLYAVIGPAAESIRDGGASIDAASTRFEGAEVAITINGQPVESGSEVSL